MEKVGMMIYSSTTSTIIILRPPSLQSLLPHSSIIMIDLSWITPTPLRRVSKEE